MADETRWSPEPWRDERDRGCRWDIVDANGDQVAQAQQRTAVRDLPSQADRGANTRRIVAAVNSVAGVPSAALEAGLLARALDLLARGFLDDDCDGSEEGCPSCEARRLLRALGRIAP
jgi:hypothetical protein